jgi:hypothetical protein
VTGELEIGEARSFDDGLLAESGTVDFTSSAAPPVPNDKVLAGFTSAVVPSDLADGTIEKPTEVLEEKLNAANAGDDDDDEIAGLLLDTANMVEAAELTAGLSVGGTIGSFGDEEFEKPLLRLAEVNAAEPKWRGAFSVVDAVAGTILSDDLMTSSAFSVLSALSELVLSNVVSLVTLCPNVDLFLTFGVSKSGAIDCLRPTLVFEVPICLSSLTEASGIADTLVAGRVPGGAFENAKPALLSTEALGTAFPGSFDESKPPDEETVLDNDATGCSLTGEPTAFFFIKFDSTNIFCSTFCSFLVGSDFCSVVLTSTLLDRLLDGMGTSRSSSNSGKSLKT